MPPAFFSYWDETDFEKQVLTTNKALFEAFVKDHEIERKQINEFQRIILIAEDFGFEVLNTAKWLTGSCGLNITCYQITLAQEENGGSEYLAAIQLFPPRELAIQRRRGSLKARKVTSSLT